ncbi:glycosyltransferase [Gordonia aichiensis]|uniref:glycosyltransferase n=1 Tax=Gordonia aichiensis TaxID=36820 RepID=UPI003265C935
MNSSSRVRGYREPDQRSPGRRVDLVAINYAPEVTGIGPYVADLARRLAAAGWDVRVLTGHPHYPQWRAADVDVESAADAGVAIRRLRHSVPASASILGRARMELEFGVGVVRLGLREDAVVVLVSPPLVAAAVVLAALSRRGRRRPPVGLWVQDLYSQAIVEAADRRGRTARAVRRLETAVLRGADSVAVAHGRFGEIVRDTHGVDRDRVIAMRNWNQVGPRPRSDRAGARNRAGLPAGSVIAVHAGNMGMKQGLENVVAAARVAADLDLDLHFYLVGDGNRRTALEAAAQGCTHLTFVDPLPDEQFHDLLSAADVLLVNEKPGVAEMSIPSKLTTYFGTGLPVVAAVDPDGITAAEITRAGAGVIVASGDPEALVTAVVEVAADAQRAATLGEAGRRYAIVELSAAAATDRFGAWLDDLAAARRPAAPTALPDARRLADYVVDKRDRGRNRAWLIAWIAVAALMRTGVGGPRWRARVLGWFGASVAASATIDRSFRVHFPWKLTIGARTEIGAHVWIIDPEPVHIGGDCEIGPGVIVCSGGHDHRSPTFDRTSEPIRIGDRCVIGADAMVLKGVRLADAAVVPDGAVLIPGGAPTVVIPGGAPTVLIPGGAPTVAETDSATARKAERT